MRTLLTAALGVATIASSALCQVTIPPHASVYNGYTRGYNFTAATNFIITQLELPMDAYQAGDTASFAVQINGVPAFFSAGTPGPTIGCSVIVNNGDIVDVVGNWSPAAASTFTAHNSYGSSAPFATTILGVPHTLYRQGVQNDIGNPAWVQGAQYLYTTPTTSGSIGRVLMYAAPQTGTFVNFSSDVTTGATPLTVNFTDQTYTSDPGGILAWAWDFDGDSVIDSTLQNPSFVYQTCGTYDVTLTTVDAGFGANTVTKTAYITTDVITPSFTYSLIAPGVVQFTDTSTPTPSSWAWDFDGDSIIDDTTQNPAHFYPAACTAANVTMTVDNSCSGGPWTATGTVVITPNTLNADNGANNGTGGAAAGNIFDVQVTNPDGVKICAVTVRPYSFTGPFTMDLYASDGSYLDVVGGVTRHENPAAWRLIGSGSGVSAGGATTASQLTFVPLNSTAYLPQGNFCLAVMLTQPSGSAYIAYTTGTASNWGPFADANMVISPNPTVAGGLGKYNLFGTGANSPRVWNGAFHYSTWSDDGAAGIGFAGTGCANSLGNVSALTPSGEPLVGTNLSITVDNLPLSNAIMVTGYGNTTSLFGPLPLDLSSFGATGCFLRVSTDAPLFLTGSNNQVVWNFNIPNNPAFSGQQFFNQAIVIDFAANSAGAVMSDASGMLIGN
ncbi:MAG: PKD domain-containing protein [Planctomycetes bacterium]|nr:PKD domain-containing protein [Planctomycetota bacterium]